MKKDNLFWFYPLFYLVILFVVIKFNDQEGSERTTSEGGNSNATRAGVIQYSGENRTINNIDINAVPLIVTNKKYVDPVLEIYFPYRNLPGTETPVDKVYYWFAVNSERRSSDTWQIPLKNNSDETIDSAGIEGLAESLLNER